MANPCSPVTRKNVVSARTVSGLRFSSGQIGLLKQMAQESRAGFMTPRLRNKSEAPQGTLALFSGPRGTGKTMAVDIVARELGLSIFPVNFKQVMSKFIGETEKNLTRVLKTAEPKKAVLLFDEADALFGKRREVKDSHDRYANIEVSYVLERLKSYPGLVILASNQNVALDPQAGCFLTYHLNFSPPLPSLHKNGR